MHVTSDLKCGCLQSAVIHTSNHRFRLFWISGVELYHRWWALFWSAYEHCPLHFSSNARVDYIDVRALINCQLDNLCAPLKKIIVNPPSILRPSKKFDWIAPKVERRFFSRNLEKRRAGSLAAQERPQLRQIQITKRRYLHLIFERIYLPSNFKHRPLSWWFSFQQKSRDLWRSGIVNPLINGDIFFLLQFYRVNYEIRGAKLQMCLKTCGRWNYLNALRRYNHLLHFMSRRVFN